MGKQIDKVLSAIGLFQSTQDYIEKTCKNFEIELTNKDIENCFADGEYFGDSLISTLFDKIKRKLRTELKNDNVLKQKIDIVTISKVHCYENGGDDSHIYFDDEEVFTYNELVKRAYKFLRSKK